jgi:hypothetical protein
MCHEELSMSGREPQGIKEAAAKFETERDSTRAPSSRLEATLTSIEEVISEEVAGDDWVPPSAKAVAAARRLIASAATGRPADFLPAGQAAATGMGSLHVYWSAAERTLQLIASDDGSTRIYHREREHYDLLRITMPSELTHWLGWLASPDSSPP